MVDATSKMKVIITANAKQLTKELDAAGKSSERMGSKLSGAMKTAGKAVAGLTLGIATLGAAMTFRFIKDSIKTWIQFEEQMVRITAIMGNEFLPHAETFEKQLRDIAAESRFTATEVAEAAGVLALAGLQFDEMGTATEGAVYDLARFAEAAGGDIEMAAGIGIAGVKAFGMEIEEMGRVMNVATNTFTSSFVTLETFGQGMKFLGPTAAAAQVSFEEAAAAIGALGNAGLQGTIAGTGLRMSINKLLSPTTDARRAMDRLGLDFVRLTPAGQQAQATFRMLSASITSLKVDVAKTTAEMKILNGQMTDMSIEEQRNQLAIAQIRQRASKEGRDLNAQEVKSIQRLESASADLSIQQQELSIRQQELAKVQQKENEELVNMEAAASAANETMGNQVTGLTSLIDVVDQLNAAGATTSEILEIFSVRGGTAMLALLGQADAFRELTQANIEAEGTLDEFLELLSGSTGRKLAILRADFEETQLVIGQAFMEAAVSDEFINTFTLISQAIRENKQDFVELGEVFANVILPMLAKLPDQIGTFTRLMSDLKPLISVIATVMYALVGVLWVAAQILKTVADAGRWIAKVAGAGEGGQDMAGGAAAGAWTLGGLGAAAGTAFGPAGTIIGGVGGAIVGGVAGAVTAMAEGGVVMKPTLALVGEAGPEAVIPLTDGGAGGMGGATMVFNFDAITINSLGGGGMHEEAIRFIIAKEFPKIIKASYGRGARGVF